MISSKEKTPKNLVTKIARAKKVNYTPILIVIILLLQIVIIAQLTIQGSFLVQNSQNSALSFVELSDGRTIKAKEIASVERSASSIDFFTRSMMEMLFSAQNTFTDSQNRKIKDPGVEINGKTTTSQAAIALFFVEPEIMPVLLEDISEENSSEILSGELNRALKIRYL